MTAKHDGVICKADAKVREKMRALARAKGVGRAGVGAAAAAGMKRVEKKFAR